MGQSENCHDENEGYVDFLGYLLVFDNENDFD